MINISNFLGHSRIKSKYGGQNEILETFHAKASKKLFLLLRSFFPSAILQPIQLRYLMQSQTKPANSLTQPINLQNTLINTPQYAGDKSLKIKERMTQSASDETNNGTLKI